MRSLLPVGVVWAVGAEVGAEVVAEAGAEMSCDGDVSGSEGVALSVAGAGAPGEGGRMVSPVISSRIKSIACVEVAGSGLDWQGRQGVGGGEGGEGRWFGAGLREGRA